MPFTSYLILKKLLFGLSFLIHKMESFQHLSPKTIMKIKRVNTSKTHTKYSSNALSLKASLFQTKSYFCPVSIKSFKPLPASPLSKLPKAMN